MGLQILNFIAYYIALDVVLSLTVAYIFRRRLAQALRVLSREVLGVAGLEFRIRELEREVEFLQERNVDLDEGADELDISESEDDDKESDPDLDDDSDTYSV